MLPKYMGKHQAGGFSMSELHGTEQCIRVVNIAEKNTINVESIKLLNYLQYYQAVYRLAVHDTRGVLCGTVCYCKFSLLL